MSKTNDPVDALNRLQQKIKIKEANGIDAADEFAEILEIICGDMDDEDFAKMERSRAAATEYKAAYIDPSLSAFPLERARQELMQAVEISDMLFQYDKCADLSDSMAIALRSILCDDAISLLTEVELRTENRDENELVIRTGDQISRDLDISEAESKAAWFTLYHEVLATVLDMLDRQDYTNIGYIASCLDLGVY